MSKGFFYCKGIRIISNIESMRRVNPHRVNPEYTAWHPKPFLVKNLSISKEGYMKGLRSKISGTTCITVFSIVVLSIISLMYVPQVFAVQRTANDLINRTADAPSLALADSYSLADLMGTWNVNTIASGPGAPYWFRGRITAGLDGSWTGWGQDYGVDPQSVSGNFEILADGTITLTVGNANAVKCRMDSGKTIVVCTETWRHGDPGTSNLILFIKESEGDYSLADLTGQWEANILVSGADTYNWVRGPIDVDPTGAFTVSLVDSTGLTDTEGDTFAINLEGLITMQNMPTAQCRMDTSKTIVVCTDTDSDDESAILLTFVKKAVLYSMDDLIGSWFVNALASGPGAPWWERGPIAIRPDGSFAGKIEDYDGSTYDMSGNAGTFTISPDGIVTITRGEEYRCAMNSDKTVFICTGTWVTGDPGTTEMKVLTKLPPCTYTISPLNKTMKAKGGSANVKVTAEGTSCAEPSLTPGVGWISASVTKWSKNKGSVKVTVLRNDNSVFRDGSLTIEGQPFAITQQGQKCAIMSMTPTSYAAPSSGGDYSFTFTVYPEDCAWTATPNTTSAFLHVIAGSGTGSGTIDYTVDPNTASKSRSGKITLLLPTSGKKKSFSVKQAAQ
jgi:hypothetical protein